MMKLVFQKLPLRRSVAIVVAVRAGVRSERSSEGGVAHFLEHMLLEGTEQFPSARVEAEYIEQVGGETGAWTDREYTIYSVKVLPAHFKRACFYLDQLLFHPLFNKDAIDREKRVVFEEQNRSHDRIETITWEQWAEVVWGENHPFGRSLLGAKKPVSQITDEKLRRFHRAHYQISNMVFVVVGDISRSVVDRTVKEIFQRNADIKPQTTPIVPPHPRRFRIKIIHAETMQSQLLLGWVTGVSYRHRDYTTMRLLEFILGFGFSGRLMQRLVYTDGVAYTVGIWNEFFVDTGVFRVMTACQNTKVMVTLRATLDEIHRLSNKFVGKVELQRAKEKIKATMLFAHEKPEDIAQQYAVQCLLEGRITSQEEFVRRVNAVSAKDIRRVVRNYLSVDHLRLLVRGPVHSGTRKNLEQFLQTGFTPRDIALDHR